MRATSWCFVLLALTMLACDAESQASVSADETESKVVTTLTYDVKPIGKAAVTPEVVKSMATIIRKRLDVLGVKGAEVEVVGAGQIAIGLPEIDDAVLQGIKRVFTRRGQLAFKIVKGRSIEEQARLQPGTDREHFDRIAADKAAGEYEEDADIYDTAEFQRKDGSVQTVLLLNEDAIDGKHVSSASDTTGLSTLSRISFELTPEGAKSMKRTTRQYRNSQMAIVLDGVIISAPYIKGVISDRGEFMGSYSKEEVREIVTALRSSPMPAKLVMVGESK